MRAIKDQSELAAIKETTAIADRAIEDLRDHALQPGRSEIELAFACVEMLRERGCQEWLQHPPVILTGAHSALPHGRSGRTQLCRGDLLIVDLGFASGGYWADITRTFVVGAKPNRRQLELFRIVAAAQQAAIEAAVPGRCCADVDNAARDVIGEAGYANQFVHRTGHGLGLEVHEAPFLHAGSDEVLAAGMVITAEPGIYIPGYGGIRLEDDLAIGPNSATRLTQAPIDLRPAI